MLEMSISDEKQAVTITFDSPTERLQIVTVLKALEIFSKKNADYDDGWKVYGSYGACFFIKDRANRIWRSMKKKHKFNPEDALDLINLACFAIRSQELESVGGEYWPEFDEEPEADG
jgi:hypothetical protein